MIDQKDTSAPAPAPMEQKPEELERFHIWTENLKMVVQAPAPAQMDLESDPQSEVPEPVMHSHLACPSFALRVMMLTLVFASAFLVMDCLISPSGPKHVYLFLPEKSLSESKEIHIESAEPVELDLLTMNHPAAAASRSVETRLPQVTEPKEAVESSDAAFDFYSYSKRYKRHLRDLISGSSLKTARSYLEKQFEITQNDREIALATYPKTANSKTEDSEGAPYCRPSYRTKLDIHIAKNNVHVYCLYEEYIKVLKALKLPKKVTIFEERLRVFEDSLTAKEFCCLRVS